MEMPKESLRHMIRLFLDVNKEKSCLAIIPVSRIMVEGNF